jgi:hypothetical protein
MNCSAQNTDTVILAFRPHQTSTFILWNGILGIQYGFSALQFFLSMSIQLKPTWKDINSVSIRQRAMAEGAS